MKRCMRARCAAMLLACSAAATTAAAQAERTPTLPAPGTLPTAPVVTGAPAGQPRIGLALSGGGARGLAHVGVLKVLEEMRIPVHCVTGTIMGAVVGGTIEFTDDDGRLCCLVRMTVAVRPLPSA